MILMHLRSGYVELYKRMNIVHIAMNYNEPTLCGSYSSKYVHITTYINYLNPRSYRWCPDCVKHPDLVMARLNETNV